MCEILLAAVRELCRNSERAAQNSEIPEDTLAFIRWLGYTEDYVNWLGYPAPVAFMPHPNHQRPPNKQ